MTNQERAELAKKDPAYAQIVCRCETVTDGQVIEAIRRGARTVSAVKMWTRVRHFIFTVPFLIGDGQRVGPVLVWPRGAGDEEDIDGEGEVHDGD